MSVGRQFAGVARSSVASSSSRPLRRTLATVRDSAFQSGKPPTAVVMMNMGGPSTIPEVHDFLSRLFHDRDLIPLPLQSVLAPFIAKRRTPKIEKQYTDIGGGSPILRWTRAQGDAMCALLDELNPSTAPHKTYVAFRYANPLTETCLDEMKADGVQRAVAFSQYPQYSCSTTGSSLNELFKVARAKDGWGGNGEVDWSVLDRWPTHPGLVDAVAHNVKAALAKYPEDRRSDAVILFSAHSLPLEIVNRGDPYVAEVAATVHAVMTKLGFSNPWRLSWQSQVGPRAWQGPQTSDSVKGFAKIGKKDIILVPIAFTSDHIETLYELDIEVKEEAEKLGVHLSRAESLNDSPIFIRALADVMSTHLFDYGAGRIGPISIQMKLRCQGCTNPKCERTKDWLSTSGKGMPAVSA